MRGILRGLALVAGSRHDRYHKLAICSLICPIQKIRYYHQGHNILQLQCYGTPSTHAAKMKQMWHTSQTHFVSEGLLLQKLSQCNSNRGLFNVFFPRHMIFLRRFFKLFLRIRGLFFPQTLSHDKTEMVVMEGFPLFFDGRISIRHGGEECRTQVITQYPRVNNGLRPEYS